MADATRRRVAPWIALAVVAVLAFLFIVLAGAKGGDTESAETPLFQKLAPAVSGVTIDGQPWELSRRKGSWVVLNFFASTCVPCQEEHPELVRFAQQQRSLSSDGAELYTIVFSDDSVDSVRQFFADHGGDWPIVLDPRGSIGVEFGVNKVPETWIISPDGEVVFRTISTVNADTLSAVVEQLRELARHPGGWMKGRRLKGWPGWLLMLGAVVALLLVGTLRDTGPRSETDRIDGITKRIACPVCSGESVFESRNAASVNIRNKVQDLVEAGTQSDAQIISAIQQDSDVQLLLVPKRSGIDALAWALPVAAAVVAFVGLGVAFRRWKHAVDTVPTDEDRAVVDAARGLEPAKPVGSPSTAIDATHCWPELPSKTRRGRSEQGLSQTVGDEPSSEREPGV